jgi:conjugal transfer pilus assembly protein TraV
MKKSLGLVLVVTLGMSGCAIVPYEDEYACNMPGSLGKCQNMTDSYQEAVTGVEVANPMLPASQRDDEEQVASTPKDGLAHPQSPKVISSAYDRYIEHYYAQLGRLIVEPKNPIIRQPTQIRMLVLPYTSQSQAVMYMSRHVYWVHQQPHFIQGDYLKKPSEILDSPMMHHQGEE